MNGGLDCRLRQTSFVQSQPPEYIPEQEWFLVFHGKLTHDDVRNMPVYKRQWWVNKTAKFFEDQQRIQEEAERRARSSVR